MLGARSKFKSRESIGAVLVMLTIEIRSRITLQILSVSKTKMCVSLPGSFSKLIPIP